MIEHITIFLTGILTGMILFYTVLDWLYQREQKNKEQRKAWDPHNLYDHY